MHHGKYQWVKVVVLTWLTIAWAGFWPAQDSLGEGNDRGNPAGNRVERVAAFRRDADSGPMAIYALQSSLEAMGFNYTYSKLAGISGATFKFVYDTTGAYEPLSGLFPTDVLQTATAQMGFERARWETGGSVDAMMDLIKREIDAGRPLIAPDLEPSAYRGFFIIAGYDLATGHLLIQGAMRKTSYDSIPIPEGWDGATASPAGWAGNPLFVIGRQAGRSGDARAGKNAPSIAAAIEVMKGGVLDYGKHSGEEPYLRGPGPHTAGYGLRAFELLSHDVAYRPLVIIEDGESRLDSDFLGRIDSQIGQLQHDRTHGYTYLRQLRGSLPPDRIPLLEEINNAFLAISEDARALREVFWQTMPADVATADSAAAHARKSSSLVLTLPPRAGLLDGLKSMGEPVFETTSGWVIVDDSPEKRMDARLLVRAILSRERNSIRILEELLPDVDTRVERERPTERREPGGSQ